jgi:hypothetical protein
MRYCVGVLYIQVLALFMQTRRCNVYAEAVCGFEGAGVLSLATCRTPTSDVRLVIYTVVMIIITHNNKIGGYYSIIIKKLTNYRSDGKHWASN